MSDATRRRMSTTVANAGTRTRLLLLGCATAVLVWTIATVLFPYHSLNHDEGVYLQQAAMLLEGKLYLRPPVADAFRPWFFVDSPSGLYPKYSPVTAATFAVGKLLGGYRIALALIAAGCVVLAQRVIATTFDERTGYLGAVIVLASPLFLIDASVFLPYVPTMFWNLAFAAAYLRADRTGGPRFAALAGLAVGVAFFARPYTAVLFALPIVAHALWTLGDRERSTLFRQGLTAAGGLLGVLAALGYNAVVTGDPLVFPYQAFAPLDGLGFGRRELLGYALEYTPDLGLRANAEALWLFATRWMAAGLLGTAIAVVGITLAVRRGLTARQAILAGLFVTIPLGNVYFWGTLNALGDLSEGGDGLAHFLGPYYHLDLLLPAAAFAAVGLLAVARWLTDLVDRSLDWGSTRHSLLAAVVLLAAVGGTSAAVVAAEPIADNASASERLEAAYGPFEDRSLGNAVVLLPTPYGDWLNHPFQALRNDPGYDDGTIYALQERQFAVVDAFPDRERYRYTYHGEWNPREPSAVTPRLQRVRVVRSETVTSEFSLGVPSSAERLLITLSADDASDFASVRVDGGEVSGTVRVSNGSARVTFDGGNATATVPIAARDRVRLHASVDTGTGTGLTYGLALPVERTDGGVRALTPSLEVCRDESRCGGQAAYVPGLFGDDVAINATLRP